MKVTSYQLNQSPLYRLQSRKRLAQDIFNVDLNFLEKLANNTDNYRVFSITQGDKVRQVEVPKVILERLHRRIFVLLARIEKPDYLQSGVKGRSYITNAERHVGPIPLVKLDLKKFYPSVTGNRVYDFFYEVLECSPDVAALLTKLLLYENHVPTGSCVSQLLAFFAIRPMLDELARVSQALGVTFTCYVDDLTFSGVCATPSFMWDLKRIIDAYGLRYHKDRYFSAYQRKVVTGVMVGAAGISVMPSKELSIWTHINSLGDGDVEMRKAAVNSLIGSVIAAGQIERRLLSRLKRLRVIKNDLTRLAA